jgi:hypothetical protein
MYRPTKLLAFCFLAFPLAILGQNYVNTPYSKFLMGDMINTGFDYNRSMGGSGIALRPHDQINFLNPASYTSQDTMSFIFQAGGTGRFTTLVSSTDEEKFNNANLEFLAMGFPITRWWKFSLGLLPFSRMEYLFTQSDAFNTYDSVLINYSGDGGINEFYFGSSFQLSNFLSIGANAGYLFGTLDKLRQTSLPKEFASGIANFSGNYKASDFYFDFGLQAYKTFGDKHQFIFGLTFQPKTKIRLKLDELMTRDFTSYTGGVYRVDTLRNFNDSVGYFQMPAKIGLGLTYIYNNKLTASFEFTNQNFTKGSIYGISDNFANYSSFRFGAEYVPAPMTLRTRSKYYQRMHYRIGAHYTNTYLNVNSSQISDRGVSVGIGLPWRNQQRLYTNTAFNITYEYGIRGALSNGLIKEKYHLITLGITLYDSWFVKSKYE